MPRTLSRRIALAFTCLALATLIGVGGTLFFVLRTLNADAEKEGLRNLSIGLVVQRLRAGTVTSSDELTSLGDQLAAENVTVIVVTADGSLVTLRGDPAPFRGLHIDPASTRGQVVDGSIQGTNGTAYLYAATNLRGPTGTGPRALAVATPDTTRAKALGQLLLALPAVLVILLLVGIPIAWLLSRSVARPLRRLAAALGDLPSSGAAGAADAAPPLPLEGPTEVRELTERFTAMRDELGATREREARLLADLRHDLRTPLTVIGGFAEALADGTATGPDAERAARAIVEETSRLERLVGELGAVERLRSGAAGLRPESLQARELLAATVDRFASRAEAARVELAIAAPGADEPPMLLAADRLAVERILANLVDNALRSVPRETGHVWLAARLVSADGTGRGLFAAPAVVFSVTDDGPGFPPGTTERVFERFFRADPSRTGGSSGLGLAIVRELARAHGGDARAENVAPHGGRVSAVLPVVPRGGAAAG